MGGAGGGSGGGEGGGGHRGRPEAGPGPRRGGVVGKGGGAFVPLGGELLRQAVLLGRGHLGLEALLEGLDGLDGQLGRLLLLGLGAAGANEGEAAQHEGEEAEGGRKGHRRRQAHDGSPTRGLVLALRFWSIRRSATGRQGRSDCRRGSRGVILKAPDAARKG